MRKRLLNAVILFVAAGLIQACAAGMQLTPVPADPRQLSGGYDLILYGCRFGSDVENMAVLVDTKSPYAFEVLALDTMYKTERNVPTPVALARAEEFIRCSNHPVWNTVFRRIADRNGVTIGYELKPLYRPWEFSTQETLQSSYSLNDGKVTARMVIDPQVEKDINASNGTEHDN